MGLDREAGDAALATYAELYGQVERKLFAEVAAGRSAAPLKSDYIREHGIPARLFNAVRVSLDGKVSAVRAAQRLRVDSLERRIAPGERQVAKAEEQGRWQQVHQKRRRLANLKSKLAVLQADIAAGRVRLCFGVEAVVAQAASPGGQWLTPVMRSGAGTGGTPAVMSSSCWAAGMKRAVASCAWPALADDGSLTLRLRMPDCLAEQYGKYLVIEGVRFAYGHGQVLAALASNAEYVAYRREHGDQAARATELGQAISYRFKRDAKGWRVFATTELPELEITTDRWRGAIGVDLNADHVAVAETDASGNYVNAWRVPLVTYGKNTNQAEALIGDAVASVVEYARGAGKPLVIEKLDFRQKKAVLEGESRKYSRMLSSFAYGKVKAYFLSRGYREGVEIIEVNPAYSSVVGRVKFMERYGLTVHQAAALVLARRYLGCSERIPRRWVAPIGNGVQVAFTVPVRKRVKHVWTYWGAISGQLRPALAAQHRLGKRRRKPNPVQAVVRAEARGVA